jgi:protein-S-isoprenylcysteine O-methyltransferase Ste14
VSPIASLVADAAVLAGFAIVFLTFRANSYTSATIAVAKEQPLVDHGPYAVVRHPMYAGALLMLLATPIALGSWWASSGVLLMVLAIVARLLGEERYLAAHLAGYADYRRRVRYRLIPYVW